MGALVTEGPHIHPAVAPARAVLFDFDFTLADSSEGIVVCMNHALGRLGLAPAPADAIRRTIGLDLHTALGILAGEEWRPREDEFLEHFVRKADEVMVASTTFLPGAESGCSVCFTMPGTGSEIVTTKYRHRVEDALERDGLRALVDVIVGADDVPRPKPAPDGLLQAAGALADPHRRLRIRRRFGGGRQGGPGGGRGVCCGAVGDDGGGGLLGVSGEGGACGCGGGCGRGEWSRDVGEGRSRLVCCRYLR